MELNKFVKDFSDQIEDCDLNQINGQTFFRDIEGWSSLTALSIIAMVDEKYNVKLRGEDIRNSKSIEDLFNIVSSRVK